MSTRCKIAILLSLVVMLIIIDGLTESIQESYGFVYDYSDPSGQVEAIMPPPIDVIDPFANSLFDPQERVFVSGGEAVMPSATAFRKGQFNIPCSTDADCKPPFRFCESMTKRCNIALT